MVEFVLTRAVPFIVVVAMTGVGLSVAPSYITQVFRQSHKLALALLAQIVLLPIIAILIALFGPGNILTASVLLVLAACPGGGVSNLYTLLAGANTALSVMLTLTGILLSVLVIPLTLAIYVWLGLEVGMSGELSISFVVYLVALIGIPVTFGFVLRLAYPAFAERWQPRLRTITMIAIILALAASIWDQFDAIAAAFSSLLPLVLMFVIAAICTGYLVGLLLYDSSGDRFALSAEFGTRHIPVASAIALEMQGNLAFAGPVAIYFLIEAVILLTLAKIYAYRTAR